MRRIVRMFTLCVICCGVMTFGVSALQVTCLQAPDGASSPGPTYAIHFQKEALAHAPESEACNLPNKNAERARDACIAACKANCGGWCTTAEQRYGCQVGCNIVVNYANGSYSY